jgi:hypothetical protein
MNLTIPGIEKRLQSRYERLVQEHSGHAQPVASGPRILPSEASSEAAATAAWPFYSNPRTTFTRLAHPLIRVGCSAATQCRDFALVDVDWSWLSYNRHHMLLSAVVRRVQRNKAFVRVRRVEYEGQPAWQSVAFVAVTLERPARLNREVEGQRKRLVKPGAALKPRLIVTEQRDQRGRLLARWYLLTNVPAGWTRR